MLNNYYTLSNIHTLMSHTFPVCILGICLLYTAANADPSGSALFFTTQLAFLPYTQIFNWPLGLFHYCIFKIGQEVERQVQNVFSPKRLGSFMFLFSENTDILSLFLYQNLYNSLKNLAPKINSLFNDFEFF